MTQIQRNIQKTFRKYEWVKSDSKIEIRIEIHKFNGKKINKVIQSKYELKKKLDKMTKKKQLKSIL